MSPSEHDKTHDKLREGTERAREGVIVLEFSFLMASVRIDAEELTYGTPRLKPTPPYAETNSNTTESHQHETGAKDLGLLMLKILNHVALSSLTSWSR